MTRHPQKKKIPPAQLVPNSGLHEKPTRLCLLFMVLLLKSIFFIGSRPIIPDKTDGPKATGEKKVDSIAAHARAERKTEQPIKTESNDPSQDGDDITVDKDTASKGNSTIYHAFVASTLSNIWKMSPVEIL